MFEFYQMQKFVSLKTSLLFRASPKSPKQWYWLTVYEKKNIHLQGGAHHITYSVLMENRSLFQISSLWGVFGVDNEWMKCIKL